ncbi:AarF/UbiB family protein [Cyclobacterium sp.]|jgi:ubiquinone biosynthesis protein|uniref:AarF/UbiB family protein n=1 Tax=Cyclobacterium sp. TaxID=1966343 RepID=UPI0019A08265|nr:AarF/UbiB family protein [Cyclobacterium sp.]MBD3631022.1 L-2-amino-thiazoline-4-carboxylic acid hydrolase [Cyclobacterium sp.]
MASKWKILLTAYKHYRAYKKYIRQDETARKKSGAPARLVADILKLGPTYIKLGQILSTRPDVLPSQYIRALEKLQENVPAFPFNTTKQIIADELEKPLADSYRSFDEAPVASASLAQVHFAVLHTGEEVAVKVQRPDIKARIVKDLQEFEGIIRWLNRIFPKKIQRANLPKAFSEFKRYTLRELDFAQEGETIERFRENFKGWDDILFPKVYWKFSTQRLLTMERVSGLRLKEAIKLLPEAKKEKLNTRLSEMELKMFISDGLFHADLHPGNIFFKEDGKIVLLDFGMYGELTKVERNRFVLYWMAVVQNDVKQAFYHFKKQCTELPGADEAAFYAVFKKLADSFYASRLKEVSITRVYLNMINAGYKYGYVFPENLLLHAKALTTAEALTFELAPDTRFEEVTRPIITREFARLALNGPSIKARLEKALPAFLLSGEIIPPDFTENKKDGDSSFSWNTVLGQLTTQVKEGQANAGLFKAILNKPANVILTEEFNQEQIQQILSRTWKEFERLEPGLPKQETLGATFTIHLACATVALYKVLLQADKNVDEATDLIYRIGWKIYTRMGEYPMLIAGMFSDHPYKKMELTMQVFRMFPFTAPDYGWQDVEGGEYTVAFNCTRCRVADYFKSLELGDLCYRTWCKLDFPLAEQWGGHLERSGSIAGGAGICDFRWKVNPQNVKA